VQVLPDPCQPPAEQLAGPLTIAQKLEVGLKQHAPGHGLVGVQVVPKARETPPCDWHSEVLRGEQLPLGRQHAGKHGDGFVEQTIPQPTNVDD
jgi:hypothetical protein